MSLQSFKDLIVWKKSIELVKEIYLIADELPDVERYCISQQMRRCAISIPSNISEGYERRTQSDYLRFLHMAQGSAAELYTQLVVTVEIYPDINTKQADALLEEIQKMLKSMTLKLAS